MRRIALVVMGALLLAVPAAAHAAAWGVNVTTDTPVGQPCPTFNNCSLREALTSTELNPGPDAILVAGGTYPLTNGQLTVTQDLQVARVGAFGATISGSGASRIFDVSGSGTAFIFRFLTMTDGDVSGAGPSHGGAILGGSGTSIGIESATISNSSVSADSDAQGGAIFSQGAVSIGVASGSTTGSSITGNSATASASPGVARGGGVAVQGASLTVGARTTISGNTAAAGSGAADSAMGGGVYADSGVTTNGTTVSGNSASGGIGNGGGLDVAGGTGTFTRSTFSGNTATTQAGSVTGGGGGVAVESSGAGSVGLQFSTVSDNTATTTSTSGAVAAGGAIASFAGTGPVDVSNSTIASNAVSAPAGSSATGAGIFTVGNTATLGATILAENTGSAGSQCDGGVLTSDGYDVLGPLGTCSYSAGTGDVTGVSDAMLKPLGAFGGLTQTRMLKLGGPALDIIPAADPLCSVAVVDQRGVARPQSGTCDSGSVEARPATLVLTPDPLTFPTEAVSQTSTASEFVSNGGDLDMSAAPTPSVAAPFSYTSGCTSPVAAGTSCSLLLTFAPTTGGSVSRTLQVTSGPLSATSTLTGTGLPPPIVTGVSPSSGLDAGGTHITITGNNFMSGATVEIGQGSGAGPTAIPATNVTVVSPTQITATTGGPAIPGRFNVFVTDSGGTGWTDGPNRFTYTGAMITGVSPSSGPDAGGTPITITGSNFIAGSTVEIGQGSGAGPTAIPATNVTVVSPTQITATTGGPAFAGRYNVFVIDSRGTTESSSANRFTYAGGSAISQVSPLSGPTAGGTQITITGSDFVAGATVAIGQGSGFGPTTIPATNVTVVSPTEITATTGGPAVAGTFNVFVSDARGTAETVRAYRFTYH